MEAGGVFKATLPPLATGKVPGLLLLSVAISGDETKMQRKPLRHGLSEALNYLIR